MDKIVTTVHPWCDSHFTSISACGVWRARAGVQVSKKELHTHIRLDYARIEILSHIYIYKIIINK